MLTLLTELRFWSARDDIIIKDTDFGAFRYQDKKDSAHSTPLYTDGKRDYAEKRHEKYCLDNKRPEKLRQSIKKLEDYMKNQRIVYCQWRDHNVIQLLLSNGLFIHICINTTTGDIVKITFDKYFVGKLISDIVTNVVITRQHIIIAYNQNQLTFVYLQRPSMKRMMPEKISRMDPKIFNVIINGPPQNRPLSRHLACNNSFDLIAVWTKSSQNEVYPWRPTVRDQDRANVHIYKLCRLKMESMCYYWTENDPISFEFSRTNQNQLHSVEQKISRKGEVTIEICIYEIKKSRMHRIATTAIPLQSQVCCNSLSPDNEKLMLGCIDGSVVIFDENRGITHLVKAAFIPTLVSWHCDSAILMIANERCQFQCFDISLACIKTQPIAEDMTPATNLLDLSGYFASSQQPALQTIHWSRKPDIALHSDSKFAQSDCYLLLQFDAGPLANLRFFNGAGLRGDIHSAGYTADVLIHKYLNLNNIERSINLLLCMNWDTYGAMCLNALHKIAAYIFRRRLTTEHEIQLQKALGSFLVPVKRLCAQTESEFGDQVRDVTRKFFQHLLRYKSYEKAFSLAIDISDEDLFMDLHNCAKVDGELELAIDAYNKAEEIIAQDMEGDDDDDDENDDDGIENHNGDGNDSSTHSICSHSSCSECANAASSGDEVTEDNNDDNDVDKQFFTNNRSNSKAPSSSSSAASSTARLFTRKSDSDRPPLPQLQQQTAYVPPLPYFVANDSKQQDDRIHIPKPELKVSSYSKNPYRSLTSANNNNGSAFPTNKSLATKTSMVYPSVTFTPDNILLVDPPLPMLTKTNSHTNILQHSYPDFIHDITRTQLYHNSTESLNHLENGGSGVGGRRSTGYHLRTGKAPKALPRTAISMQQQQQPTALSAATTSSSQQHHVVIDVVPKPNDENWTIPDQTIGIPLTFTPRAPSAYNLSTNIEYSSATNNNIGPIIHQHPITLATIPKTHESMYVMTTKRPIVTRNLSTAKETNSILSMQSHIVGNNGGDSIGAAAPPIGIGSNKKENGIGGEKNKVKFSDTITVAVVPEIPRKDKSLIDRMKRPNGFHSLVTDPRKELADSLPLCHPNDDYLKDFTPMSSASSLSLPTLPTSETTLKKPTEENTSNRPKPSTIKVVHFGVV